jgi:Uma2 family endonuclease
MVMVMSNRTLLFDGPAIVIPAGATTFAGFRRWVVSDDFPDGLRATFAAGEVILDMSPESFESHNQIKTIISARLSQLVADEDLGYFYSDRTLITDPAVKLSSEPDAAFASWATLESGRLKPVSMVSRADDAKEFVGRPDWVLEIVSNSSFRKDTIVLREQYFEAGVPEYWLIDARGEEIDFKLLVANGKGYRAQRSRAGWFFSPVFNRDFSLSRERDRLGGWRYLLDQRA